MDGCPAVQTYFSSSISVDLRGWVETRNCIYILTLYESIIGDNTLCLFVYASPFTSQHSPPTSSLMIIFSLFFTSTSHQICLLFTCHPSLNSKGFCYKPGLGRQPLPLSQPGEEDQAPRLIAVRQEWTGTRGVQRQDPLHADNIFTNLQ